VSPYARRLFDQMAVPEVDAIDGPAARPSPCSSSAARRPRARRSGSVTTLSNLLRMLYSRAGDYPPGQPIVYAEAFSPNTPEGACPHCHGLGRVYEVTERSMVPDDSLSIRDRAVAAWPPAWHGQNLRDILVTLGYDVDRRGASCRRRTASGSSSPTSSGRAGVPGLHAGGDAARAQAEGAAGVHGPFTSAKRYVLHAFATTESAMIRKRVSRYLVSGECPACGGKRLKPEALAVTFAGLDIAEMSRLRLSRLAALLRPAAQGRITGGKRAAAEHPEKAMAAQRIAQDLEARLAVLLDLGLGYLSLERSTPTLSPGSCSGCGSRRRCARTCSAWCTCSTSRRRAAPGGHRGAVRRARPAEGVGNTLFVVEHDLDVVRRADWLVDVGPEAGEHGGRIQYSGPPAGLARVEASRTRRYLFAEPRGPSRARRARRAMAAARGVTRNNLRGLDAAFPTGALTTVTGVLGLGEVDARESGARGARRRRARPAARRRGRGGGRPGVRRVRAEAPEAVGGRIVGGLAGIRRLVPWTRGRSAARRARTSRRTRGCSTTCAGCSRRRRQARARRYDAGRFSFNVAEGALRELRGRGIRIGRALIPAERLRALPGVPRRALRRQDARDPLQERNVAEVLGMTVDAARDFFAPVSSTGQADEAAVCRSLDVLRQVGLGYLRLGQPATELSGGEAQRIKLATELQRAQRGDTLYVLDEPTTGLHPADVEKLLAQLDSWWTPGTR
jgi:excinuclease ABC subunit A